MLKIKLLFTLIIAFFLQSCEQKIKVNSKNYTLIEEGTSPFDYKVYELKNGMRVHLSKNTEKPRIQTYIGVKVGSKNDPSTHTGLAHYLEHMLFKGTSKLGTDNWKEEVQLIDKIKQVYEAYGKANTEEEKVNLYSIIDSLSYKASTYAIANEYDKILSEIGGTGTNAYTSMDQTVYLTNIPSTSLEKWLEIETERFSELVLRIFHTELEAVYEEFNIGQESDNEKVTNIIMKNLFPNHTYGTQTTIGKAEHLKKPSMLEIEKFFNKYYVPNNMIMALSGDFNYETTIENIADNFNKLKRKELVKEEIYSPKLNHKQINIVKGKENSYVEMAYRLPGLRENNNVLLDIIDGMLNNGFAGLIDINLLKKQKVQDAYSYVWSNKDYSTFILSAHNKKNQTLESVETLLLDQIENLKTGNFKDWLPKASWNYIQKNNLESINSNSYRANELLSAGIYEYKVSDYLNRWDAYKNIDKEDIVKFVKDNFNNQLSIVHKEQGKGTSVKVKAPKITPIKLRRNVHSDFYNTIKSKKDTDIEVLFTDINKEIKKESTENFYAIENTENDLFNLYFLLPLGSFDDPYMSLALEYSKFLGTNNSTTEELTNTFFKNGLTWDVQANSKDMYININGLKENSKIGVEMIKDIFSNPKPNAVAFKELINSKKKKLEDANYKKDYLLWNGLLGKVKFSNGNPLIEPLSIKQLNEIKEIDLINKLKTILSKVNKVFYYGPKDITEVKKNTEFVFNNKNRDIISNKIEEKEIDKKSYFVNHDMVQSELLLVAKKGVLNQNNSAFNYLFKGYYGTLAFRELRESKALAYSSYITLREATYKNENDYILAYIGCQVDKFPLALHAVQELLKTTPTDKKLFNEVKENLIKSLKSKRIKKEQIFWTWEQLNKKGFDNDFYLKTLDEITKMTFEEYADIFNKDVKNLDYSLLVIGNKENIDLENLKQYGAFTEYSKQSILQ